MSTLRRALAAVAASAVCAATVVALPFPSVAAEPAGVRINEVESSGGTPGDWVEFVNTTSSSVSLAGFTFKDDDDTHAFVFGPDATIPAGGVYVIDEKDGVGNFGFGLGGKDSARLFDPNGQLVDSRSWTAHAATTYGFQPGGSPDWTVTAEPTKGAGNVFGGSTPTPTPTPSATPSPTPTPNPTTAPAAGVVVNEIVYDAVSGVPSDSIELFNAGASPVDIGGWKVSDDKRTEVGTIAAGTVLAPGAFLVLVNGTDFPFGLGKGDEVVLFDSAGAVVDSYAYVNTAPLATWARCPDGTGAWAPATVVTLGAANVCAAPSVPASVRLNEVDSQPADWVELYNPGSTAFDLTGYELRDNSDDHRWMFLPGTTLPAGGFLVVDEATEGLVGGVRAAFRDPIGIGSADRIRLFDAAGTLVDDTLPWQGHAAIKGDTAAATLARCPDGLGDFVLARPTPGADNDCVLPDVVINEVESNGDATDWVEIVNRESAPLDISGWILLDNDPIGHAADVTPVAAGTVVAPGGRFVFDGGIHFSFGLGGADTVTIRSASGITVAEYSWTAHAQGVYARCSDGVGELRDVALSTKNASNACGNPVRINEVESDGGSPDDWIELVNPTGSPVDAAGLVLKDDDDTHVYTLPAGSTLPARGHLVVERADLGFGLGGADSVRLFERETLLDSTTWTAHAVATWGRCPDSTGVFGPTFTSTKGAANVCEAPAVAWPGVPDARVVDTAPTFLSDSSGLDSQVTADGTFLWAVDNGTGTFWKLRVAEDGSATPATGWENGKRARFPKDASNAGAAGPDAEGITVAGDDFVYLATERDNSAKGVNRNTVLKVDPNAPGPDVVANQEWDLTASLPAVAANVGLEAVEWIADTDLRTRLIDQNTGALYDPARYPGHGAGLFFTAVEDNGHVYAFALNADGTHALVAEIASGLPAAMALDWDSALGVLWAMCDDGCHGDGAQVTLNGTVTPDVVRISRPTGLPDTNNEGFATLPVALGGASTRPAWWFTDGLSVGALRVGGLPTVAGPVDPTPTPTPTASPTPMPTASPTPTATPSATATPTVTPSPTATPTPTAGGTVQPLPGDQLTGANRGPVRAPGSAVAGSPISVVVDADRAGQRVQVWLYSTPTLLAETTVDAQGRVAVTLPAGVTGSHRIAVYALDGTLLGWAPVEISASSATAPGSALASTGGTIATGSAVAGGILLLAGLTVMIARRRRTVG